jgi:hypothetical protein
VRLASGVVQGGLAGAVSIRAEIHGATVRLVGGVVLGGLACYALGAAMCLVGGMTLGSMSSVADRGRDATARLLRLSCDVPLDVPLSRLRLHLGGAPCFGSGVLCLSRPLLGGALFCLDEHMGDQSVQQPLLLLYALFVAGLAGFVHGPSKTVKAGLEVLCVMAQSAVCVVPARSGCCLQQLPLPLSQERRELCVAPLTQMPPVPRCCALDLAGADPGYRL